MNREYARREAGNVKRTDGGGQYRVGWNLSIMYERSITDHDVLRLDGERT